MASIRDVAKRANVAACTVSRVLNGTANVAPETRMKIEQAMKELNYIPNELARSMFKQKAGIVAMLVPDIRHPYFSSLARHIEDELYKNDCKLMLCSTGDDPEREKEYMKILRSNIVDGVIMGVNNQKPEAYAEFGKPLVMLDYYVNDEVPVVVSDHEMGGRLAAEEFIRSECRYVLHIGSEADTDRVLSYKSHRALRETLEEFAVIAYDGTYVSRTNIMEITTIHQQLHEIGNRAVDTILRLIDGEMPQERYITIPVELKKGSTT